MMINHRHPVVFQAMVGAGILVSFGGVSKSSSFLLGLFLRYSAGSGIPTASSRRKPDSMLWAMRTDPLCST